MGGDAILNKDGGFTLIECIITLAIFSIVLSLAMGLYLTGYKLYRSAEGQTETEENVRVVMNRITQTLRWTDHLYENVSVENNVLKIRNYRYYLGFDGFHEMINYTSNNLARNISHFEARIEDNMLKIHLEGVNDTSGPPFIIKQIFYLGGE